MSNDTPPDWMTDEHLRAFVDRGLGMVPPYAREILRLRADIARITAENLEGGQEIRAANEESARLRAKLAALREHVPTVAKMAKDLAETEAELDAARAEVERLTKERGEALAYCRGEDVADAYRAAGAEAHVWHPGMVVDLSRLPLRTRTLAHGMEPADLHQSPADLHQFDAAIAEASDYFTEDPQIDAILKAIKALAREVRR